MSTRTELAEHLKTDLPTGWQIVPYERDIDPPSRTVLMVRQHRITFDTNVGRLLAIMQLTAISKHTDNLANAEDDLDDGVNTLLDTLLTLAGIRLDGAEKTRFGKNGYPAWNIDIAIPLERKI